MLLPMVESFDKLPPMNVLCLARQHTEAGHFVVLDLVRPFRFTKDKKGIECLAR